MKNNINIQRAAILSLLAVGLGATAVHAQQPKEKQNANIENTDPFKKGATEANPKSLENLSAEILDAQARILFARGETDKAIATQEQAVEKAKGEILKYSENLARYKGINPAQDGPIQKKLRSIIIPRIDFEDTTLEDAIEYLRRRSVELDDAEPDAEKKGFNFVVLRPRGVPNKDPLAEDPAADPLPSIAELRLRNVPLSVVLKYICDATNYRMQVDEFAVTLEPAKP